MRITTAGESHGKGLFAVIEGFPAGLEVDLEAIDAALSRRQGGYGRGARQQIERDRVEVLSGVRGRVTTGSPILLAVYNRDYENWKEAMSPEEGECSLRRVPCPRPGHADFAGTRKFETSDARNILERASARTTAARVAAGEVCRQLLSFLGVEMKSFVKQVGTVCDFREYSFEEIAPDPLLSMADEALSARAKAEIDEAISSGDTLGGVVEVRVFGLKAGFGSCMTDGEKLDARLAASLMSIQAVKGVEVGIGFRAASLRGSAVHDPILIKEGKFVRASNRAGGIEGGMSNGEEIVLRAAMKPIPTLREGLPSVDLDTLEESASSHERSDGCAVSALSVVALSAVAEVVASAVLERLGGDTVGQIKSRYEALL